MTSRPYVETLVFLGGISADVRAWVPEHPDEDNPIAWGTEAQLSPGGRAAGAAVAAVRLGRRFVDLIGCVGDDLLGESIVSSVKEAGVSVRLVDRIGGVSTGIQQVVVDANGERRTVGVPNANLYCGESQVLKADSNIFGADLLYATLEVPLSTVTKVVELAASRDVPVLLDATPVPTAAGIEMLDKSLLKNVDVLLVNWSAAQRLADIPRASGPVAVELAKRLLRLGPKAVVITMGEHGSMVAVRGRHALVEPFAAQAVDSSSAGDAFGGGLAVGLTAQARGDWRWGQLLQGARYASAVASVCITQTGGHSSLPLKEDVERLLAAQSIVAIS